MLIPEDRIRRADDAIYEIFREFRLFHYINPANHWEERERFLEAWELGRKYQPRYEYNLLPSKLPGWKKRLDSLNLGASELETAYSRMLRELRGLLEVAEARGTAEITIRSERLYGAPEQELSEEALSILRKGGSRADLPADTGVKGLAERLRERLRADRIEGWDVIEDPTCVGVAEVDWTHHKIRLQSGILLNTRLIERLTRHLVDVHVFRAMNGERQPYKAFAVGLEGYLEVEEGLGVELEERLGLLRPEQQRSYAGRVLAAAGAPLKSFFDIVSELVKFFPVEEAYALAERSKRGLADTSIPGGFVFDHVFLRGKKKVELLPPADLNMLFIGKIAVEHLPLVRELLAQDRLLEPAFVPDAFHG